MKGLGYSIEAIVAILTIFLFSLGAVQVSESDQNWNNYQREVAAQDLTFSMESIGLTESFIRRGETGSLQTAMTTISDRNMEVSGILLQLPVNELQIAYFTLGDDRKIQTLTDVSTGDTCFGDLGEIQDFSSDPIIKTENDLEDKHDVTLYFGNTNSTSSSQRPGYDALWVDNGTECQFDSDEGPHYIDEVFFWGDKDTVERNDYYDFKKIDWDETSNSGESVFYNATQPVRISNSMRPGPNNIETDITVEMVNKTDLENNDYDAIVFRERDSLNRIIDEFNLMNNLITDTPFMLLMDLQAGDIENNRFMNSTGISWIDLDYEDSSYSGGEANASFSSEPKSVEIDTFYTGLSGSDDFKLSPPGKVVSNTSDNLNPSRTIYSNTQRFDSSKWQRNSTNMKNYTDPLLEPDRPNSECYDNFNETSEYPLSNTTLTFPGSNQVGVLSAKLGSNTKACNNLIERGIKFDFDNDGSFESDMYLNGEDVNINGVRYFIEANKNPTTNPSCDYWGECVNFIPSIRGSDDFVELMVARDRFQNLDGSRFAMTGFKEQYNSDQRKALSSTLFWLTKSEQTFEGEENPNDIDSISIGSIEGEVYLPYNVYLRWSE